jgi:predicted restriction endonuclease
MLTEEQKLKRKEYTKNYRINHRKEHREYNRLWAKNNPEKVKAQRLKNKEGKAEYRKNYYQENKEEENMASRLYYQNNKQKVNRQRKEYAKNWRTNHKELCAQYSYEANQRIKKKIFDYYGHKCTCCGETEEAFLTLDHINGGGTKHRKEIGFGTKPLYMWLIKHNFPPEFQTLCMNCQFGKRYGHICPHQLMKKLEVVSTC